MNILNAFPVKFCLTLPERTDRQELARGEFRVQGMNVDFFHAIPDSNRLISFNHSYYQMVIRALKTFDHRDEYTEEDIYISHALFFEDDVVFGNCSHLPYAFEQLPADWDVLYLGANITNGPVVKYSQYLCKPTTAWTTHAIAMSSRVMQYIVDKFDPLSGRMFDDWLSTEVLPIFNCFIVNPMCCTQRPGKSDLWNCQTDYTDCFNIGNKMMAAAPKLNTCP